MEIETFNLLNHQDLDFVQMVFNNANSHSYQVLKQPS